MPRKKMIANLSLILPIFILTASCACSSKHKNTYLYKIYQGNFDEFGVKTGYVNSDGDTVIAPGKYVYCYSDTLKYYAFVMKISGEIIAIGPNDNELFEVFKYDNGPDYISEGLFRIIKNKKIGYADTTGKIVIKPQYDCAYPFRKGQAKVSNDCVTLTKEEHHLWRSSNWFYIDKKGKKISSHRR